MNMVVYHVTSSIFLNSIKEHGLISIDIRKKLPNLSLAMSEIINYLELNYSNYGYDWGEPICFHDNCKRMANTGFRNRSKMDYEYGNAYVTPCRRRIQIYNTYEFGSELLTYFYRLYRCLFLKFNDKFKNDFDQKYPELVRIIEITNKKNYILKADVDTSDLLTDIGNEIDEKEIEFIKMFENTNDGIPHSYRLKRTLHPEEIQLMFLDNKKWVSESFLSEYNISEKLIQVKII